MDIKKDHKSFESTLKDRLEKTKKAWEESNFGSLENVRLLGELNATKAILEEYKVLINNSSMSKH